MLHAISLIQDAHFQNIPIKLNLHCSVPLQTYIIILKLLIRVICRV